MQSLYLWTTLALVLSEKRDAKNTPPTKGELKPDSPPVSGRAASKTSRRYGKGGLFSSQFYGQQSPRSLQHGFPLEDASTVMGSNGHKDLPVSLPNQAIE